MPTRSFGVTALAFSSVMIALYCQFAAIALILTGSALSPTGEDRAGLAVVIGGLFLALMIGAYFLGFGLWTRKPWAWAGGIAVFAGFVFANLLLSVISTSFLSTILPAVGAGAGIWYLLRPGVKAELIGREEPTPEPARVAERLEAPEPAH